MIYTMVRAADWRQAEAAGEYRGSADDRRDGFLHFSAAGQLRASAAKHRAGEEGLLLVAVRTAALGPSLRWETAGSRPGLFPHVYGALPLAAVASVTPLPLGADGLHAFPDAISPLMAPRRHEAWPSRTFSPRPLLHLNYRFPGPESCFP